MEKVKRYTLIGAMGCGKSALARRITGRLGGTLFYTDAAFTRRYGNIRDFFAAHGESEFRRLEKEIMIEAAESPAAVVATGGGAVLNRDGMSALRRHTEIVFLTAPIEVLKNRIKNSDRPLKDRLEQTVFERAPLYNKYADYVVDSSVDSFAEFMRVTRLPRKNRYDAVLCDADNTLLDFDGASVWAIGETVRELGLRSSESDVARAFLSATGTVWKKIECGELTREQLIAERVGMLCDMLGEEIDPYAFNGSFMENMKKTRLVIDGAIDFLDRLGERKIKRYIITNGFANVARERLKALEGRYDGAFISEEIGAYKPARGFFDKVFAAVGNIDPSRVLVFGDGESSDIAGGKAYGLDTCLYDPSGVKPTAADYSVRDFEQLLRFV